MALGKNADAGHEIGEALEGLADDGAPDGMDDWTKDFADGVKETILLAGVHDAIKDALAGGGPAAGPSRNV